MQLGKTYSMAANPIPPIEWNDYLAHILGEYSNLLSQDHSEDTMQTFFEKNPCFIPGAFGLQSKSGHNPLHNCIISQPRLPGITSKIPDFMWIAKNSDSINPILIEIEAPTKKYFNQNDSFTADFNQAKTQLIDWKAWFDDSRNIEVFKREYDIDEKFNFNRRRVKPFYLLIYGRSFEISSSQIRSNRKAQQTNNDIFVMTYDRLSPSHDQSSYFCGKRLAEGYFMHEFPEYVHLSPNSAGDFHRFKNIIEAIRKNERISESRVSFLCERIGYWNQWVESGGSCIRITSDKE